MPFRSKEVLDAWLEEYSASAAGAECMAYVAEQEAIDGLDSGLVIFPWPTRRRPSISSRSLWARRTGG
ncbi:hypothetical protein HR12_44680 [Microbacterium sp. SUBG005]|nr:hypothetical protein HR12_44680 [Microbacterium sp. SUBG005]